VDPSTARYASEYAGVTYCFCSAACQQAFDQNPERYARRQAA